MIITGKEQLLYQPQPFAQFYLRLGRREDGELSPGDVMSWVNLTDLRVMTTVTWLLKKEPSICRMEKLLELVEGWNCFFSRSMLELAVKLPGFVNVGLVEWVAARQVQHWMGILLRLSYQHGFLLPYYAIGCCMSCMSRNHKTIHSHRFGRSLVFHKYLSWALN